LHTLSVGHNEFRTRLQLLNEAAKRVQAKNSHTAHIIGSGWSLNHTVDLIPKNDFVFGFNFAPLARVDLDIYFIEFGGYKYAATSDFHRMLAEKFVIPSGGAVYFKNIWEKKNELNYIQLYIKGIYPLLKDYLVPCLSRNNIRQSLEFCLNTSSDFVPQIRSTAITSIFLAFSLGFKKIIAHGIDFGGGYFFEQDNFAGNKHHAESAKKCMYNKPLQTRNQQHPSAERVVGLKQILPVLQELLNERGVYLYTASSTSPSSEILPVYFTQEQKR